MQKQKERDEKIVAAQKIKQEIDEKKQKAIKEQYERKIKASEELLAQQNQKLSEKIAAKAKKLEEAKKHHDETIAAKIKDAEQKLAKIVVSVLHLLFKRKCSMMNLSFVVGKNNDIGLTADD